MVGDAPAHAVGLRGQGKGMGVKQQVVEQVVGNKPAHAIDLYRQGKGLGTRRKRQAIQQA